MLCLPEKLNFSQGSWLKRRAGFRGTMTSALLKQSFKLFTPHLLGGNCVRALPDLSVLAAHNFSELGTEWHRVGAGGTVLVL